MSDGAPGPDNGTNAARDNARVHMPEAHLQTRATKSHIIADYPALVGERLR